VGDISREAARDVFRVALTGGALRRQAIVDRLGREPAPPVDPRPAVSLHLTEYLDVVEADGARHLACRRCGHLLCAARKNYKARALRIDRPIQAANPLIGDPARFIDAAVSFRQFYCPACGGLLENEVCRADDPVLWDIELAE
jgi:acetophenone carboxylase